MSSDKADSISYGFSGIYIINQDGIPVFAKMYQRANEENTSIELISGFLTAINKFGETTLNQKLRNIGFENRQYFFSNSYDFICVAELIVEKNSLDERTLKEMQSHIEMFFDALETSLELMHSFEANEQRSETFEFDPYDISPIIDNLVYETEMSLNHGKSKLSNQQFDEETPYFDSEISKEVTSSLSENHKSLWKKLTSLFR